MNSVQRRYLELAGAMTPPPLNSRWAGWIVAGLVTIACVTCRLLLHGGAQ